MWRIGWRTMRGLLPTIEQFSGYHKLTPRESEVVGLICEGMKSTAIAECLAVSHATVRMHIRNVHRKAKTSDKTELVLRL